ncbi:tRNA lysidine(34) synthetase TilS [Pseudomonas protegens]|uniref:tRNA lysidine(34) synthetase TilS n=1 Tax=Pseudomonas protegens TaxID=380021 RepID=UPI000F49EB6C|nr:tRNA lysidine(34) synthetase TilS [Pseudomonas protegens]ROL88770.1 tRNA lysidine(34) synthetase TilS [Pseudomonas protegens]ROM01029.1 tRNA lysidine(34) synthetase TilS [Pseudomonas protegens]ROM02414.1 tRNA lysidine(34) synthetase TilS [Pseudomonas protegens]ROM04788.1 tRNA lysidine(34) synthetase TilS [Pseudomonas protegens]
MNSLSAKLLKSLAPWREAAHWRIAFSGGLDSTVLLHLLVDLAHQHGLPRLTAVHVHHGLQAAADAWPAHCQAICAALGVPLQVIHVQVRAGSSLEGAAREARYGAFERLTAANELLLTAQHRDDQAETLLFRLLRGAGVRGLSAMPESRPLGAGHLMRPLLGVSRAELERYAAEHCLSWVQDPSNADHQYSRNYLRHQVMPSLIARWPQAATSISRSAAHLREAQGLLDELAMMDLATAEGESDFPWLDLPSLALAPLQSLSPARQRNVLSHWLSKRGRLPDTDHWAGWESLRDASAQGHPRWCLADGEVHRAGGRIWWLSGAWLQQVKSGIEWQDPGSPLQLPNNGQVFFVGSVPQGPLHIRYRQGGEVMQVAGRGHRDLKRLLNEAGLPSFVRGRLPLLYQDERLLAVANLPALAANPQAGWQLYWRPLTSDQGLS